MRKLAVLAIVLQLVCLGAAQPGPVTPPKLVLLLVVDQFRGDILPRLSPQMESGGFRLLTEHGADYLDCAYDYANLRTAPGHASLGAGAYTDAHGIPANDWWNPAKKKIVSSVEDDSTALVGGLAGIGASPRNLHADTFADELRLATNGRSRTFGIALKDRSAILPVGFSANAAYWIDKTTGEFQTSTYYMAELPDWARQFNSLGKAESYWGKPWRSRSGEVLRENKKQPDAAGALPGWYDVLGATPAGVQLQLDFAKALFEGEKLGQGDATDFLSISISSTDILGHQVGPDSVEYTEMVLALDHELAGFLSFIDQRIGLKNTWIALSADHGVAPAKSTTEKLRIPSAQWDATQLYSRLNVAISKRLRVSVNEFVPAVVFPYIFLSAEKFAEAHLTEVQAEDLVAELLKAEPIVREAYARYRLAAGDVPRTHLGTQYLHSYSPVGGWYVLVQPAPFFIPYATGDDHYTPFSYDTHVPLVLYGSPFRSATFRSRCEPIDLAPTWSVLLGINRPTHAYGRVLTEAVADAH